MAAKVSAIDTFKAAYSGLIGVEKSKRGLGKQFHSAVIDLLNENPGMTGEEVVKLFLETLTEVENTLRGELVEAFGPDAEVKEFMPSWVQYKSDYKRALELVDRRDLMKCGGVADVKKKLNEVREAMKEKESESGSTGESAENGGGKADTGGLDLSKIPESARKFISDALITMSKLTDDDATEVAVGFKTAAVARLKNMANAKKKFAGAGVNSASVANNH